MKVCIFGCRHFNNPALIPAAIAAAHKEWGIEPLGEMVTGGCRGVDEMADEYAQENPKLYDRTVFYANWAWYGKGAGPKRNRRMALYVDRGIAIWDGKSQGTRNMIQELKALGKPVFIYYRD